MNDRQRQSNPQRGSDVALSAEVFPPELLAFLKKQFSAIPGLQRAVLFGSRARGDHAERSDYDIAVFGTVDRAAKDRLRREVEWEAPTLHKIDLVFFEDCRDEAFKQSIVREGIAIYDQEGK